MLAARLRGFEARFDAFPLLRGVSSLWWPVLSLRSIGPAFGAAIGAWRTVSAIPIAARATISTTAVAIASTAPVAPAISAVAPAVTTISAALSAVAAFFALFAGKRLTLGRWSAAAHFLVAFGHGGPA